MANSQTTATPAGDRWIWGLVVALLVWAPIPLGSNRPWALALLALATGLVWLLQAWYDALRVGPTMKAGSQPSIWRQPGLQGWRALLLAPILIYALLTLAQRNAGLLEPGKLLGTLDTANTDYYLLAALSYLAMMALVLSTATSERRIAGFLGAIVASAVLQAIIGAMLLAYDRPFQWFYANFQDYSRVSGTFKNPDHFAGYMQLGLAAGFGLLVAQFSGQAQVNKQGWQGRLRYLVEFTLSPKMLLRLMLVILVLGLVLTRSRGGNGAFFIGLLAVGSLVAWRSQRLRKPAMWLIASILVIDTIILGQWIGLDKVLQRMKSTAEATAEQYEQARQSGSFDSASVDAMASMSQARGDNEESLQERWAVALASLPLIAERPWLGHGAGSYYLALPKVKPAGYAMLWDHAHNDYVEIAVDSGALGLLLLLGLGLVTAGRAVYLVQDRHGALARGVGTAGLLGLLCLGIHALVDFNLQIPANAITLVALAGLVWAVPAKRLRSPQKVISQVDSKAARQTAGPEATGLRLLRAWPAVLASALFALTASVAWPMLRADFSSQAARQAVAQCERKGGQWTDEQWAQHFATLERAITITPRNASLISQLAHLYGCRGIKSWDDEVQRTAAFKKARELLDQSLTLRPDHAQSWANHAMASYVLQAPSDEIVADWREAYALGPNEIALQQPLFELALRIWPATTPDIRNWVLQRYQAAPPKEQARMRQLAQALQQPEPLTMFNAHTPLSSQTSDKPPS